MDGRFWRVCESHSRYCVESGWGAASASETACAMVVGRMILLGALWERATGSEGRWCEGKCGLASTLDSGRLCAADERSRQAERSWQEEVGIGAAQASWRRTSRQAGSIAFMVRVVRLVRVRGARLGQSEALSCDVEYGVHGKAQAPDLGERIAVGLGIVLCSSRAIGLCSRRRDERGG